MQQIPTFLPISLQIKLTKLILFIIFTTFIWFLFTRFITNNTILFYFC